MKKLSQYLLFFILLLFIAGLSSIFSIKIFSRSKQPEKMSPHEWIHQQLRLTPEEHERLEPTEKTFHQECKRLQKQLHQNNQTLAQAILTQEKNSAEVKEAIKNIHITMGELQEITIAHVFDMKIFLTPEQYNKLLHLTADALISLDSDCKHE